MNITSPDLQTGYLSITGSGMGAALTAGACALLLQWSIEQVPSRVYETNELKAFFIRGAIRDPDSFYPNREWGYGRLNAYQVFAAYLYP